VEKSIIFFSIALATQYMKELSLDQVKTRERLLQLLYKRRTSHIGSCFSCVDIIDAIYRVKKKDESFVLSAGHAAMALYAVLERKGVISSLDIDKFNVHPDRNEEIEIDCSTGSLGQGLPIAVGMALADRSKRVYCVLGDGECAEGSVWEALRVGSELKLTNLIVVVNANGYAAYDETDLPALIKRISSFGWNVVGVDGHDISELTRVLSDNDGEFQQPLVVFAFTKVDHFPFLDGLDAHYYVMNSVDYEAAVRVLNLQKEKLWT